MIGCVVKFDANVYGWEQREVGTIFDIGDTVEVRGWSPYRAGDKGTVLNITFEDDMVTVLFEDRETYIYGAEELMPTKEIRARSKQ